MYLNKTTTLKILSAFTLCTSLGVAAVSADELKLAHFSSTKYHLHNEMFLPLAEKIADVTGGETTMRVYPGGELGKGPVKQYDRAIDGVADIVYALPGYTALILPSNSGHSVKQLLPFHN
jgi:TRAP-type C4-dicarboxylate transport system substrate-binding protein